MLPASLSFFALGSAAAARAVVGQLLPWLFMASLFFLGYAHYWVWIRGRGHRRARWILTMNTVLVAYLWYARVQAWLENWFG